MITSPRFRVASSSTSTSCGRVPCISRAFFQRLSIQRTVKPAFLRGRLQEHENNLLAKQEETAARLEAVMASAEAMPVEAMRGAVW